MRSIAGEYAKQHNMFVQPVEPSENKSVKPAGWHVMHFRTDVPPDSLIAVRSLDDHCWLPAFLTIDLTVHFIHLDAASKQELQTFSPVLGEWDPVARR